MVARLFMLLQAELFLTLFPLFLSAKGPELLATLSPSQLAWVSGASASAALAGTVLVFTQRWPPCRFMERGGLPALQLLAALLLALPSAEREALLVLAALASGFALGPLRAGVDACLYVDFLHTPRALSGRATAQGGAALAALLLAAFAPPVAQVFALALASVLTSVALHQHAQRERVADRVPPRADGCRPSAERGLRLAAAALLHALVATVQLFAPIDAAQGGWSRPALLTLLPEALSAQLVAGAAAHLTQSRQRTLALCAAPVAVGAAGMLAARAYAPASVLLGLARGAMQAELLGAERPTDWPDALRRQAAQGCVSQAAALALLVAVALARDRSVACVLILAASVALAGVVALAEIRRWRAKWQPDVWTGGRAELGVY